jgi:hypothetical protein
MGQLQTAPTNSTCALNNCRLIINNTGNYGANTNSPTAGLNVYSTSQTAGGAVTITPPSTTVTLGTYTVGTSPNCTQPTSSKFTLSSGVLFANASTDQDVYISDTPVTYLCDSSAHTLTRYWGYTINETQPTDPTISPLSTAQSAVLANNISSCSLNGSSGVFYSNSSTNVNGVVSLILNFQTSDSQTTTLMQQIQVKNPL